MSHEINCARSKRYYGDLILKKRSHEFCLHKINHVHVFTIVLSRVQNSETNSLLDTQIPSG